MHPDFTRYSCQLALPGFNEETQSLLQNAKVLIVGAGGLGCPAALYLTSSGIGTIGIADYDSVSITNLHRQVLYTSAEVGLKKTLVACAKLQQQNPGIQIISHEVKITSRNVMDIIQPYDLVMDCTDNFETKYLLNDACVLSGKPLVYGAIFQYEGQVAVWNLRSDDGSYSHNYRDIFPEVNATKIPNCNDGGVIATLAGIIGCMQANEAIKYCTNDKDIIKNKMILFDAKSMQTTIISTGKVTRTKITALPVTVDIPAISVEDYKKFFNEEQYQLIDVRSTGEHMNFNIGGSNFPINDIEENIPGLNFEKTIVMYCETGKRSGEAVKFIKNKFPELQIYSLEGGLQAWKEV